MDKYKNLIFLIYKLNGIAKVILFSLDKYVC
jgi:hypothetical protein